MNFVTALEIVTNPLDLVISVKEEAETRKFSLCISRGQGHDYKVLLDTPASYANKRKAECVMRKVLVATRKAVIEFKKKNIKNAAGKVISGFKPENLLNSRHIHMIMERIKEKGIADTENMGEAAKKHIPR